MTRHNRINKQNIGLLGTIFGGLMLGIPAISLPAYAQTFSGFMSEAYCPGVYISYLEAYNQTDLQRCPLTARELRLREQQQLSDEQNSTTNFDNSTNDIQPTLFEDEQNFIQRRTSGDFEDLSRK